MPAVSKKQQKAAAAELERRKHGAKKSSSRPFGTALTKDLEDFAGHTILTKKKKKAKHS